MEKSQQDNLIGAVLGQRFQIIRLIGQGGMANVYLATDLENNARVAVKVLKSEFLTDQELVRRFDVEAKAASSLSHPNIVKVYGVGEENGILYMVMQYVEGMTLKEMIDQYGKLDWRVAVPIVIQIVKALDHAHSNGIVHRDIKPHNIMITRDHRALVTDFGIARASTANTITLSGGSAMGSVHYFSPEQARGAIVGAKADIYSLGILMYEMLTGRVPFDGDTSVAVAIMHLHENAMPPIRVNPSLPQGLSDIVMKCIRKNPSERYESAQELGIELAAFARNPGGTYGQVRVDESASANTTVMPNMYSEGNAFNKVRNLEKSIYERRKRRHRDTIVVFLVVLLCIALVGAFFSFVLRGLSDNIRTGTSEDPGVPLGNYVNQPIEKVTEELNRLHINFQIKQEYSDKFAKGIVMDQNLPENKIMKQVNLNPLILTVSKGSDEFKLEDYTGRSLVEVENVLRNEYRLNVRLELVENDKVPQDHIIKTDPPPGSKLRPGYSIKIFVSTGPKLNNVPNLAGMTLEKAKDLLEQNGLKLGKVTGAEDYRSKDRIVEKQTPEVGERVKPGSAVDLIMTHKDGARPKTEETYTDFHGGDYNPGISFPFGDWP